MIVTLHQINATVGDFKGNLHRILKGVQEAEKLGSSLALFPELALTGYPPLDLLETVDFHRRAADALKNLQDQSRDLSPAIIVGTILPRDQGSDGKPTSNAAVLIRNGRLLAAHRKVLLPTYDVFDETRYFHPGDTLTEFEIDGHHFALSICEDIWNDKTSGSGRLYQVNPLEVFFKNRNIPLINISASPFSMEKSSLRREMVSSTAKRHRIPVLYVNLVGGNDSLVFDGASIVVTPEGNVAAQAADFTEQVLSVNLDNLSTYSAPLTGKGNGMEALFCALKMGVKDYVEKCGFRSTVLGLSGGIDSSITAAIACGALGPEHVHGVLMPSPYTSSSSVEDALALAENLGIRTSNVPITDIYHRYLADLEGPLEGLPGGVTEENIQARIRGNILMAFSNKFGHLVLSTGNKSELATGYCTLYGDMSGGLAVISDLYKGEVYELASHINRDREVIPASVLTKPPSAELKPNQEDSDFLPPYDLLDPILRAYIDEKKPYQEILEMGYSPKLVKTILNMVEGSEYKRQQAAPGLKVSWKAFGIGRRCPVAKSFHF